MSNLRFIVQAGPDGKPGTQRFFVAVEQGQKCLYGEIIGVVSRWSPQEAYASLLRIAALLEITYQDIQTEVDSYRWAARVIQWEFQGEVSE